VSRAQPVDAVADALRHARGECRVADGLLLETDSVLGGYFPAKGERAEDQRPLVYLTKLIKGPDLHQTPPDTTYQHGRPSDRPSQPASTTDRAIRKDALVHGRTPNAFPPEPELRAGGSSRRRSEMGTEEPVDRRNGRCVLIAWHDRVVPSQS